METAAATQIAVTKDKRAARIATNTDKTMKEIEQIQDGQICAGLNESAKRVYLNNKDKGFWDNKRNVGELLMLVVSELGEAMEAHRKGKFADSQLFDRELEANIKHEDSFQIAFKHHIKDTFEDEISDAIIRLLDLSAGLDIDIEWHIQKKIQYNKTRGRLHGKKY